MSNNKVLTIQRLVGVDGEGSSGGYYILTQRHRATENPVVDAATMGGSDETGSHTGTGVPLGRHLDAVGERVGQIAERLGLPAEIVADLCFAGRLHDLGGRSVRGVEARPARALPHPSRQHRCEPVRARRGAAGARWPRCAARHHRRWRLVFGIFAATAEFEGELICERTMAGLKAAPASSRTTAGLTRR